MKMRSIVFMKYVCQTTVLQVTSITNFIYLIIKMFQNLHKKNISYREMCFLSNNKNPLEQGLAQGESNSGKAVSTVYSSPFPYSLTDGLDDHAVCFVYHR